MKNNKDLFRPIIYFLFIPFHRIMEIDVSKNATAAPTEPEKRQHNVKV